MNEKIEILPVNLLDQNRPTIKGLKKLARSLHLEFGWHYLLDISWIVSHLGDVQGKTIIDAGAGTGVLQWYLANVGAHVLSVDRASRASLPMRFRKRFNVTGHRPGDLLPIPEAIKQKWEYGSSIGIKVMNRAIDLAGIVDWRRAPGSVTIYNQDLRTLNDIGDDSVDAVVAVSALEHNTPGDLILVVNELMRVLKPGGVLLATLGAARDEDWFHEPSHGWCYTEASLKRLFALSPQVESNYPDYDELFSDLKNCAELRDNLAAFYTRSGDNGMPWGVWDPQYQTVGVLKIKPVK